MRRPKTLTAAFCRTTSTPGTYGDGRGGFGLTFRVKRTRNGRLSKVWAQRVVIGGKPTYLGLGTYPTVTLAEARRRALKNRREIEAGRDPRGGGIPTFARATEKVIALHRDGWKPGSRTESAWRNGFGHHVYPKLGHR
ncbi:MAG: Arm DNA-binding domain-containing protein, partial [bacterium]|nr:Arm DNA-binding domain-containing protein [bacterium]